MGPLSVNDRPEPKAKGRQLLGWLAPFLALGWIALARWPLVLNAADHLDSDLAVDGLTLIDALHGRWRWHYPATPFIGSPPVLLSSVQALIWGANPITLASGGLVAYLLVALATYAMTRRAFGATVAAWGLVPLAFASTGVVWLSGRVTGGHLLATAWFAGAFALAWGVMARGKARRWAMLGLWCGLGLWVDSMFAAGLAGLGVAAVGFTWANVSRYPVTSPHPSPPPQGGRGPEGQPASDSLPPCGGGLRWGGEVTSPAIPDKPVGFARQATQLALCLLAFAAAGVVGVAPRIIGARVDPHDAYAGQFAFALDGDRLARNAGLLARDCLPRLIAGHRLPGLQAEPDPSKLAGGSAAAATGPAWSAGWIAPAVSAVSLLVFFGSIVALLKGGGSRDPTSFATRLGLLATASAVVAAFLVHPSITDSDNYRYLVFLLVPYSAGFGLMADRVASKGRGGKAVAFALALVFAGLMAVDSARWYGRLGWLDASCRPIRKAVDEPVVAWLEGHPEVSAVVGDYWDVYRLSFLTEGRVVAVPFPVYPDRFPETSKGLAAASNPVLVARPGAFGPGYRGRALAGGGRERLRGKGFSIVDWPKGMTP